MMAATWQWKLQGGSDGKVSGTLRFAGLSEAQVLGLVQALSSPAQGQPPGEGGVAGEPSSVVPSACGASAKAPAKPLSKHQLYRRRNADKIKPKDRRRKARPAKAATAPSAATAPAGCGAVADREAASVADEGAASVAGRGAGSVAERVADRPEPVAEQVAESPERVAEQVADRSPHAHAHAKETLNSKFSFSEKTLFGSETLAGCAGEAESATEPAPPSATGSGLSATEATPSATGSGLSATEATPPSATEAVLLSATEAGLSATEAEAASATCSAAERTPEPASQPPAEAQQREAWACALLPALQEPERWVVRAYVAALGPLARQLRVFDLAAVQRLLGLGQRLPDFAAVFAFACGQGWFSTPERCGLAGLCKLAASDDQPGFFLYKHQGSKLPPSQWPQPLLTLVAAWYDLNADGDELQADRAELGIDPKEPATEQDEPATEQDEPGANPDKLAVAQDKPEAEQDEPGIERDKPTADQNKLEADRDEAVANPDKLEAKRDKAGIERQEASAEAASASDGQGAAAPEPLEQAPGPRPPERRAGGEPRASTECEQMKQGARGLLEELRKGTRVARASLPRSPPRVSDKRG